MSVWASAYVFSVITFDVRGDILENRSAITSTPFLYFFWWLLDADNFYRHYRPPPAVFLKDLLNKNNTDFVFLQANIIAAEQLIIFTTYGVFGCGRGNTPAGAH